MPRGYGRVSEIGVKGWSWGWGLGLAVGARARLVSESYLLGGLGLRRLARALVGVRVRVRIRG